MLSKNICTCSKEYSKGDDEEIQERKHSIKVLEKAQKKSFCIISKVPKTFSKAKHKLQICLATKAIGSKSAMTGWLILGLLTCKRHMST